MQERLPDPNDNNLQPQNGKKVSPVMGEYSEGVETMESETVEALFGLIDEPQPTWPEGKRIRGVPSIVGDSKIKQVEIKSKHFADVEETTIKPYSETGSDPDAIAYLEEESGQY